MSHFILRPEGGNNEDSLILLPLREFNEICFELARLREYLPDGLAGTHRWKAPGVWLPRATTPPCRHEQLIGPTLHRCDLAPGHDGDHRDSYGSPIYPPPTLGTALAVPSSEPATGETVFQWLIERGQPEGLTSAQWLRHDGKHPARDKEWTTNAHAAAMFPTREAAEEWISDHDLDARAVEHGFVAPSSEPAEEQGGQVYGGANTTNLAAAPDAALKESLNQAAPDAARLADLAPNDHLPDCGVYTVAGYRGVARGVCTCGFTRAARLAEALTEYVVAHTLVEKGATDFDLHHEAVDRLMRAMEQPLVREIITDTLVAAAGAAREDTRDE